MSIIDKNSKIPLYMQLYIILKEEIANGTYAAESFLPSESELLEKYGLSRITIRRALTDLENDGYVKKIRGKGTKVYPKKQYSDLFELTGFNENAMRDGQRPASIILKFDIVQANVDVAEHLQINPGENVYYLKRLRLLNGRINGIHHTFISQRTGLDINISNWTEETSLYDYYGQNGISVSTATEVIQAMLPTPTLVKELYISELEPIFYRERVTYDSQGNTIEYSQNYYIAKEHKYFVQLKKDD